MLPIASDHYKDSTCRYCGQRIRQISAESGRGLIGVPKLYFHLVDNFYQLDVRMDVDWLLDHGYIWGNCRLRATPIEVPS